MFHRLAEAVVDVVVLLGHDRFGEFDGLLDVRSLDEAEGAHGFEAHARCGVLDGSFEDANRVRYTVHPVAGHANGLRAGARFGRLEHGVQQLGVDGVVPLMDPEGFEAMVLEGLVSAVESFFPFLNRRDDCFRVVGI